MQTVSEKFFECPVCYFELYKFPAGILRAHTRRVCPHYIHVSCAQHLTEVKAKNCPLCHAPFTDSKVLPDLFKDPRGWFQICDADFGGTLDAKEVTEGIGALMPLDRKKLKRLVKAHWHVWDPDGDGVITLPEFLAPDSGLKDFLVQNIRFLSRETRTEDVPLLDTHPRDWFDYWDRDGSGTMEKEEFVRAMIKSYCISQSGAPLLKQAFDMRNICNAVWEDLGFHDFDSVPFDIFMEPHGLADQIMHNWVQLIYFGDDEEFTAE